MIAPLCLFMLFAAGDAVWQVTHKRDDQVETLEPPTKTSWGGDWRQAEYCHPGSYAYAFKMNVGNPPDPTDDTGVNGIVLFCRPVDPDQNDRIASEYKNWGKWQKRLSCPGKSNVLTGVSIKSQSWQGASDDTAVNNFQFTCSDGTILTGVGGPHGEWDSQENCPPKSAICGIKTRVENFIKPGLFSDNTALNGARFYCCST